MLNYLFLIPALPFAGFLLLALRGRSLSRRTIAIAGSGSVGLSALLSLVMAVEFISARPRLDVFIQTFWTWMEFDNYQSNISFLLDPLSLLMVVVITVVGFLIHLYSTEFMADEEGYSRFFAYMNLFVGSMLVLVLADNLLLLYLGWEGVGLCSYLLIGFWYKDPANGRAARKAFVVTRIGDTALAVGLFLLFTNLGTLDIHEILRTAPKQWPEGSSVAILASALLLGGAVGKSAQLPLQTWLPDAMAGPTPVSALIHAATMVTAGVYLIARTHVLFLLAPPVLHTVAWIGALTLLLAGFSALVQRDIKRVLAYSTISQIGYMFLALGVGAWSAAMFHFMTHAFFKALLFLAAGVVILAQRHEHDMFRMGGLRTRLPLTFWTFLIGAASLSALPLATAGFYSKDLILVQTLASGKGNVWLWVSGIIGALITALYAFRMVFITFFGEAGMDVSRKPGRAMTIPLVVLAFFSIFGGFTDCTDFLDPVFLTAGSIPSGHGSELLTETVSAAVALGGVMIACILFLRKPGFAKYVGEKTGMEAVRRLWFSGWGFDALYQALIVRPFLAIAALNKDDIVDSWYSRFARFNRDLHALLTLTQTGNIRWYAMALALGGAVFIGAVIIFR